MLSYKVYGVLLWRGGLARRNTTCRNTKGNALSVPLECCLFSCSFRYFFFAGFFADFLAAFFAGAFLAFLVAICLFSLFDGLHRFCN